VTPLQRNTIFHALCVLEDAFEASRQGRVAPSPALRLAVAYLFSVTGRGSKGGKMDVYAEFWRAGTMEDGGPILASQFGRRQTLNACFNWIAREAGMERDVSLMQRLSSARERYQAMASGAPRRPDRHDPGSTLPEVPQEAQRSREGPRRASDGQDEKSRA